MSRSRPDSFVSLNGKMLAASDAKISPLGAGFMAGYALFETIAVREARPTFFADHLARLRASAQALRLGVGPSDKELKRRCVQVAEANGLKEGSVKIVVFREDDRDSELIVGRPSPYSPQDYTRGFRLKIVRDLRRAGGAAHKTTNYLKPLLARDGARAEGADEALFVGEDGRVYEGAATNIFAVREGKVITPPAVHGILPGIARGQILRRWPGAVERDLTWGDLLGAQELFVTNALLGVMPVSELDNQPFACREFTIVPALMTAFAQWQRESVAE